jgi:hypothetical protein
MRGKIDLFAIDTLVNMPASAGLHVEMKIRTAADNIRGADDIRQSIHSAILYHRTLLSRTPALNYPLTSRGFHWIQEYPYNR